MTGLKHFLDNIEKYTIYVVMTALLTLMFVQVIARYVFGVAWGWAEQVSRLLFVYVTFAGMSWACKSGDHLRVSFAAEFCPGKYGKHLLYLIGDTLLFSVVTYLCYLIFLMVIQCAQQHQVFPGATFIPIWVMYLAGVLGMFGMAVRTLQFGIIPGIKRIIAIKKGLTDVPKEENVDSLEGGN